MVAVKDYRSHRARITINKNLKEKMHITPLNDRIICKKIESENKKGILIVKDNGIPTYEVVAVPVNCTLSVGDKILIEKYSAQEIELENELLMICKLDNVIGVLQ